MYLPLTAAIGPFAALLMYCGDMLLYFTTGKFEVDGTLKPYFGIMAKLPDWRLKLGGLLGPVAAFFYCIGFCHIALAAVEEYRVVAVIATLILSLGIIVGGAYHSQFTYFGLIGRTGHTEGMQAVSKNVSLLSTVSLVLLALGVLVLGGLIVFGKTAYPRWFIILTPLCTYFIGFLLFRLPQPFRVVLWGGWYNLMFVIYFGASLLMTI